MKKMMKACLALATVAMLTPAAGAADKEHSPFGRVRAEISQKTSQTGSADAVTALDMKVDARFGHTAKLKGETWTTEAHAWFDTGHMSDDGVLDDAMDMNIQFSKEDLKILLGRYEATGVWHWAGYADALHANTSIGSGVEGDWAERRQGVRVSLPKMNVDIDLGLNDESGYSQTDFQVKYFGNDLAPGLGVNASYHMRTRSIDEAAGDTAGGANDGYAASAIGLSVKYSMDKMNFLFGLDMASHKAGNSDDTLATQRINLCFDYGLGGDTNNGVSVTYGQKTQQDSADVTTTRVNMGVEYAQDVAGARLFAGLQSGTEKDDATVAKDNKASGFGARIAFDF